ncbi:hypothetical protein TEA_005412 [Camellia sinensis var. sinensis]|uniref:Uncharacterized protein n=1 Tax=Camellia sinensis var. sinensis TaxID=542762 RepID=A0A4S4DDK8_CAMSN|nr:hypothetical protein TEA_005412 [Camellia sinensis var. sinensis]
MRQCGGGGARVRREEEGEGESGEGHDWSKVEGREHFVRGEKVGNTKFPSAEKIAAFVSDSYIMLSRDCFGEKCNWDGFGRGRVQAIVEKDSISWVFDEFREQNWREQIWGFQSGISGLGSKEVLRNIQFLGVSMNSRMNSGKGFLVPPENETQIGGSWLPLTPDKPPNLPRSNGVPLESQGNQAGRSNWHEVLSVPDRHTQQLTNYKGNGQNFNLIGFMGQKGSSHNGGFDHNVGSYVKIELLFVHLGLLIEASCVLVFVNFSGLLHLCFFIV